MLAKLAIRVYNNPTTPVLRAYMDHLSVGYLMDANVLVAMEKIIKPSERTKREVTLMHTAFSKCARAIRSNKRPNLLFEPLKKELRRKEIVNYLSSLL